MPKERLSELLSELHKELEQSADIQSSAREQLLDASEEIHKVLVNLDPENSEDSNDDLPDMQELQSLLESEVQTFENSHPTLSGIVRHLIDTLSSIGV